MELHQRYIQTPKGMEAMKNKILKGDMGFCPNVSCHKQPMIPYGHCLNSLTPSAFIDDNHDDS